MLCGQPGPLRIVCTNGVGKQSGIGYQQAGEGDVDRNPDTGAEGNPGEIHRSIASGHYRIGDRHADLCQLAYQDGPGNLQQLLLLDDAFGRRRWHSAPVVAECLGWSAILVQPLLLEY